MSYGDPNQRLSQKQTPSQNQSSDQPAPKGQVSVPVSLGVNYGYGTGSVQPSGRVTPTTTSQVNKRNPVAYQGQMQSFPLMNSNAWQTNPINSAIQRQMTGSVFSLPY